MEYEKENTNAAESAESAEKEIVNNKKGKKHAPHQRPNRSKQLTVNTKPGDHARYLENSLRLMDLPPIDKKDPEQVKKRVIEFFEICQEDDARPTLEALALATGIDRRRLTEYRKNPNHPLFDICYRAHLLLQKQMVDYMVNGKINPVSGIFLLKNNFGYRDQQDIVVEHTDPLGAQKDKSELERKYIDSVAEEVE